MQKHKALLLTNNEESAKELKKCLGRIGCEVTHWRGIDNLNELKRFHLAVYDKDMWSSGIRQDGIERALAAEQAGIKTPRILYCSDSRADVQKIAYENSSLFDLVIGQKDPDRNKKLKDVIYKTLGRVHLDVGITGMGIFGTGILEQLRDDDVIHTMNIHSEHCKNDYANLWLPYKITDFKKFRGFQSIDEMVEAVPNLDVMIITAGEHGATAPTEDRNASFEPTMEVIRPRLVQVKNALEHGRFTGMIVVESGPQDIIMPYMVKEMGFPADKITGVSPDSFRAKFLVRRDIQAKWSEEYEKLKKTSVSGTSIELLLSEFGNLKTVNSDDLWGKLSSAHDDIRDLRVDGYSLGDIVKAYEWASKLQIDDISIDVMGGRTFPVPLFSSSQVDKKPLDAVYQELFQNDGRDRLTEDLRKYGHRVIKIVEQGGKHYVDSPEEIKAMLETLSRYNRRPEDFWYCFNPEHDMFLRGPVVICYDKYSVSWDPKAKPKLSPYDEAKLQESIAKQKAVNNEMIKRYKEKKT